MCEAKQEHGIWNPHTVAKDYKHVIDGTESISATKNYFLCKMAEK